MAQTGPVVAALCVLLYVTWRTASLVRYKTQVRRHNCGEAPTYPHKDPFLGLDYFFAFMKAFKGGYLLDFNDSGFSEYGKTFTVNSFGTKVFKTIDPEVSKAVHATYFANFGLQGLRYNTATHLWGNGIIVVDGPHWKHGRALMKRSFEVVHLANMERLRKHTETFLNLLPADGSTVNLTPLFKRFILDSSSEFIFGEAIGALEDSEQCKTIMNAFEYTQRGTGIRTVLGRFKFLHRDAKWWKACDVVTDYADKHVDRALQRLKDRETHSQSKPVPGCIKLVDEMARDTQDRLTLRSHILSVFSPAHDGAATVLTNVVFHLARHPGVWERQCVETTILPFGGGHNGKSPLYVEKGDVVEINYRTMCRDESFWGSDADQFKPERWEHVRPGWQYTPFGGGPRACPGMRLAFTESAYVLVNLLRMFERLENRDPEVHWKEECRLTFQSKNGCIVALVPKRL
ncbi:cytochrome P450 [Karstenula rhodostoma CBS 690.94]|uniref:Cytochrome P450 n=1 Tax=Karstenula rhodostoma CBS 690.94 TaxID=1392251 RepID=A0A9P4U8M7_9PLEO|nr:cytochrome P450 [Karstenula rhodostoma CBS 690.94]